MEELLTSAAKTTGNNAEIFTVSSQKTEAVFESNRLKQVHTKESEGTALRLIKDGRIGFSASSSANGKSQLLNMAMEMAPFGAEARFEFPGPQKYSRLSTFDPKTESISEEELVHLGQTMIDRICAFDAEVVCEASVSRQTAQVTIANARGGTASYKKSVFSIALEGVLIKDTDMLFVGDHEASCSPIESVDFIIDSTIEQLRRGRPIAPSLSGNLPVIFTPHGVVNAFVSPLVAAFNGKTVLRGASPLVGRNGEKALSANLSVRDDATLDMRPASAICDHEGIPTRRNMLIENGVIGNFFYDLQTAGEAGTQSTGNASRGIGSLPSPSIHALIIDEGQTGFADMLAGMKEGLIVEQLMGATQGNIIGGDFSGNLLLGYRVENGQITGRVKNTMVSGNIYRLLTDSIVIGNDPRWLGGSVKTPSIYCPSVAVAAT